MARKARKKIKIDRPIYPMPDLIRQLLCTINMFEGTDEAHVEPLVEKLRDVHLDLKNLIGRHPAYQANIELKKLDKAYRAAGWDDNGLRWHTEDETAGEDIFIVEFEPNTKQSKWKLA